MERAVTSPPRNASAARFSTKNATNSGKGFDMDLGVDLGILSLQATTTPHEAWGYVAQQQIQQQLALVATHMGKQLKAPTVLFNLRGKTAGQARYHDNTIRINHTLLSQHGEAFLRETLAHELAHLVTYAFYKRKAAPHGAQWAQVMALFGEVPTRCHQYAVEAVRTVRRFEYRCGCKTHQLSTVRHARVVRKKTFYRCISCGDTLLAVVA